MNYFIYKVIYIGYAGDLVTKQGIIPARHMKDAVEDVLQTYSDGNDDNVVNFQMKEAENTSWPNACLEREDIESIKWFEEE